MINDDEKPVDFMPDYNILGQPKKEIPPINDPINDSNASAVKKIKRLKRIITIILLIIGLVIYLKDFNFKDNKEEVVVKESKVAKSDFIYKDTIEGYRIIVKQGFDYRISKKPKPLLIVATSDSVAESKSICYMVIKGYNKNGLSPEEFLMAFQNTPTPNTEITYMQVSDYTNGFKKGHAYITVHVEDGTTTYGTIELYFKNGTYFQIMVLYKSLLKAKLEEKLTDEILNSFEILS
jgi:hypothetical protein